MAAAAAVKIPVNTENSRRKKNIIPCPAPTMITPWAMSVQIFMLRDVFIFSVI